MSHMKGVSRLQGLQTGFSQVQDKLNQSGRTCKVVIFNRGITLKSHRTELSL